MSSFSTRCVLRSNHEKCWDVRCPVYVYHICRELVWVILAFYAFIVLKSGPNKRKAPKSLTRRAVKE